MTAVNTFLNLIEQSHSIVIIQADNPDADSLGSALALDEILGNHGKDTHLYCGVDIPGYLRYLPDWSRVNKDLPKKFDTAVIVDTSTETLLEKIRTDINYHSFKQSNVIVLDHHTSVDNPISSQLTICDDTVSSTSELIYTLAIESGLSIPTQALDYILTGILGDTQGLSNNLAKPLTYRIVADLIENGADRSKLEESRREYNKLPEKIYRYKSDLISRTELYNDNRLACVVVTQNEINEFSALYNPAALIQPDMLQIESVKVSVVFKTYDDGRITAAIRTNNPAGIAAKLAEEFGGGGHDFASGFKITNGQTIDNIKNNLIAITEKLLDE